MADWIDPEDQQPPPDEAEGGGYGTDGAPHKAEDFVSEEPIESGTELVSIDHPLPHLMSAEIINPDAVALDSSKIQLRVHVSPAVTLAELSSTKHWRVESKNPIDNEVVVQSVIASGPANANSEQGAGGLFSDETYFDLQLAGFPTAYPGFGTSTGVYYVLVGDVTATPIKYAKDAYGDDWLGQVFAFYGPTMAGTQVGGDIDGRILPALMRACGDQMAKLNGHPVTRTLEVVGQETNSVRVETTLCFPATNGRVFIGGTPFSYESASGGAYATLSGIAAEVPFAGGFPLNTEVVLDVRSVKPD